MLDTTTTFNTKVNAKTPSPKSPTAKILEGQGISFEFQPVKTTMPPTIEERAENASLRRQITKKLDAKEKVEAAEKEMQELKELDNQLREKDFDAWLEIQRQQNNIH